MNYQPTNYELNVFCDGGARGNPGPAASAFILQDSSGHIVHQQGFYLGVATNNQAEYQAVIEAFKYLSSLQSPPRVGGDRRGGIRVNFYLDSQLVVRQLTGIYKIKDPTLKTKYLEIQKLSMNHELLTINYFHIPRAQNSAADLLVNQTLDKISSSN